ncbi:uncharacterized protein DUF3592 [Murinocardiopsis flavida]|uniref:Uncharacterized protein DUF3592 n=1 Tax=Murinocardiopsis flavida TaxID=645275 RepID=A0A2P8DRR5_9ACTN|nr:DUF3592 domain-containing protein [Murinocardiopsis flavida]PSK99901.1 uncharacterized protein DUF3592 [Murinocardiopsis flavida]
MRSRRTRRTHIRGGGRILGVLVLAGFAFVLTLIGGIFSFVGTLDYREYTGRADATVVERRVESDTDTGTSRQRRDDDVDITVYVDYQAEGRTFEHVTLNGLNPDDHQEGDRVQVAYPPGEPGEIVTVASTEEGAFRIFGYIGVPLLVLGLALAGAAVFVLVRRRRSGPGDAPYPPPGPHSPPYGPPPNGPYR